MLSLQYSPSCPRRNIASSTAVVVSLDNAIIVTRQHNDKAIDYQHAVPLVLPRGRSDSETDGQTQGGVSAAPDSSGNTAGGRADTSLTCIMHNTGNNPRVILQGNGNRSVWSGTFAERSSHVALGELV